jgi:hypothetical protein|tara:strand:- start:598 stop:1035 length:438 start_codon:yes stop_codon:yes gene_type:complete
MANIVPYAFPVELLSANHNFASDTFKLALYTANPYTTASTVYVVTSETTGTEYSAGGNTLSGNAVSNVADIATVDFTDSVWGSPTPATFSAAYGTIYNSSDTNKLVVILDFSGTKSCSNGTFTVTFPSPTSGSPSGADALLSITS